MKKITPIATTTSNSTNVNARRVFLEAAGIIVKP